MQLYCVSCSGRGSGVGAPLELAGRRTLIATDEVAELVALFEPEVSIGLLHRPVPPAVSDEIAPLLDRPGYRLTLVQSAQASAAELAEALGGRTALAQDIAQWVELLGLLTGASSVGVRLARLASAMCPRLHVDHVSLRLVCTYSGLGTQYVRAEDVDRRWLGHARTAGREPLKDGARVRCASPGDVVLLKGEAWPGNAGKGAVHRSPRSWPGRRASCSRSMRCDGTILRRSRCSGP